METPAAIISRLTGSNAPSQDTMSMATTAFGHVLPSSTHALQIEGRPVSSDTFLFEKQQTFNRAKILERMVHPCGSGAFGYFEVTNDVSSMTKAAFLSEVGKRTPIFSRFSTVTYGREFPDSGRNPRGFAIKFYTEQGNYDLVGLNWPVFFVRDPMKGPDVIRSQQRQPDSFLLDFESWFDFLASNPESMHAGAMLFSDSATPVGWRFMNGFGCHTFKWVNAQGQHVYIKYHFRPEDGTKYFTHEQAQLMSGMDPDFAKRDLWQWIEEGRTATWTAYVQIMTSEQAAQSQFDPFDVTKVWPHAEFPLKEIGRLVLNRNPENYHRDVEEAAFSPGNLVPGIEPSPDLLLNWRMFFYRDAQYHRLGVNHHQVPVNCPFMASFCNPQSRDGLTRADLNGVGLPQYNAGERDRQQVDRSGNFQPVKIEGVLARNKSSLHEGSDSEFDQVRRFVRDVLDPKAQARLCMNTAMCLRFCSQDVQQRYLGRLQQIDGQYASGVRDALSSVPPPPTASDLYEKVCKMQLA